MSAAGTVMGFKHGECVPQCAIVFEKLLRGAGAPLGACTVPLISHEQPNILIEDPRVKGLALKGGVSAGLSVAARAGQNMEKSVMELGGFTAFMVTGLAPHRSSAALPRSPCRSEQARLPARSSGRSELPGVGRG